MPKRMFDHNKMLFQDKNDAAMLAGRLNAEQSEKQHRVKMFCGWYVIEVYNLDNGDFIGWIC